MKEIRSWKRNCPPCIVLLSPANLFLLIFLLLKKLSRFMKNIYFRRKKLSRFFVLLFSKAETFAKMDKNCKNCERFCPRKFLPLKYAIWSVYETSKQEKSSIWNFFFRSFIFICKIQKQMFGGVLKKRCSFKKIRWIHLCRRLFL